MQSLMVAGAVILRILSNPMANVFQKQLTAKKNHPLVVNFLSYLMLSCVCVPIAFKVKWTELPASFWYFSILSGMVGALGNGILVKALQKGDLSVLGPVNAYKSVIGIIGGVLLLHEIPNIWGLIGVGLIIYGSYFVLDTTDERFSWALLRKKEIQFRIWAMILTAVEAVLIKRIILVSSPTVAFVSWCWFGALFAFVLLKVYRIDFKIEFRKINRTHLKKYFLLIACVGTMQYTTNYVFDHVPVGYALSLFQLSILVSVLLGHRIFNELGIRKKLIGSAIMVVGSILIVLLQEH
jgi:Predicted membrane protein